MTRAADFGSEARRQSRAVALASARSDDQDFVEAVSAELDE